MWTFAKAIWLKAKTLRVLKEEYGYNPAVPGIQTAMFNGCIRHVLSAGGAERDAAALFLITQVGMMSDPKNLDDRAKDFVRGVRDQIWLDWDRLVIQDDLEEMMDYLEEL